MSNLHTKLALLSLCFSISGCGDNTSSGNSQASQDAGSVTNMTQKDMSMALDLNTLKSDMSPTVEDMSPALEDMRQTASDMAQPSDMNTSIDMAQPLIDMFMQQDMAQPSAPKDHIIFVVTPHGLILDDLLPTQSNNGLRLPATLKPFETVKDKMLVVQGLSYDLSGPPSADPRLRVCSSVTHGCPGFVLTNSLKKSGSSPGSGEFQAVPDKASIDQIINASFSTPLPSLVFGTKLPTRLRSRVALSYDDTANPTESMDNPTDVIKMLQSSAPSKQSVLHQRLQAMKKEYKDNPVDPTKLSELPALPRVTKDLFELLAIARTWEITRAFVFQLDSTHSSSTYTHLGTEQSGGINRLGHDISRGTRADYLKVQRNWAKSIAGLAVALDATKASDGSSMLDHTVIVWVPDTGQPNTHSSKDIPAVIIGNLSGKLKQGKLLTSEQKISDLLYTLAEALGASNLQKYGRTDKPPKKLNAILAKP